MKIKEPVYTHYDDPDAPRWVADTVVGRFVYGQDNTGQCYIQVPSGERDVSDLAAASKEAHAEYVAAVLSHPIVQLIESTPDDVPDDVADDVGSSKPGEIIAHFGQFEDDDHTQLIVSWGDGVLKADANLILDTITRQQYHPLSETIENSMIEELTARGYDMSTFRVSVTKKPASGKATPAG